MKKTILITNDDGVNAIGLQVLERHLKDIGCNVLVVAPDRERSCCGHGLSLGKKIFTKKLGTNKYSCDGLPADCTHLGIKEIFKDSKIDLVLSGINHGSNLGQDIYYSGTVAGAREACFLGIPSMALSISHSSPDDKSFNNILGILSLSFLTKVINKHEFGTFININSPDSRLVKTNCVANGELLFRNYENSIEVSSEGSYVINGTYVGVNDKSLNSDTTITESGRISISFIKVL